MSHLPHCCGSGANVQGLSSSLPITTPVLMDFVPAQSTSCAELLLALICLALLGSALFKGRLVSFEVARTLAMLSVLMILPVS